MIIDIHTRVFPDSHASRALAAVVDATNGEMAICGDGTLEGLCGELTHCAIDFAVTLPVATRPDQVASINSYLPLKADTIIPFGALNPYNSNWEEALFELVDLGVKGVKLHPEFQDFYIDDIEFTPFFRALEKSELIVLTHAGYDPGPFSCDHGTPRRIANLLDRHPGLTLIAGHLGGLMQWDDVEKYLVGKKLFFDTAAIEEFISQEQFERIVVNHGVENILYGSDYPWDSPRKSIDFIGNTSLSDSEKELILGLNAKNLLGIE